MFQLPDQQYRCDALAYPCAVVGGGHPERVFFHNGEIHSLEDAVRFYVERDTRPERWYPRRADGTVVMYDDLPAADRTNVDVKDAPFNRRRGDEPALSEQEIKDVVAFLKTLTDNYRPTSQHAGQAALSGSR